MASMSEAAERRASWTCERPSPDSRAACRAQVVTGQEIVGSTGRDVVVGVPRHRPVEGGAPILAALRAPCDPPGSSQACLSVSFGSPRRSRSSAYGSTGRTSYAPSFRATGTACSQPPYNRGVEKYESTMPAYFTIMGAASVGFSGKPSASCWRLSTACIELISLKLARCSTV